MTANAASHTMSDIVERLRLSVTKGHEPTDEDAIGALAEIERLQELLRGTGANRYWEGRWRDDQAEIEQLRTELEKGMFVMMNRAKAAEADNARLRAAIEQALDDMGEQGLSVCQQAKEMLAAALKGTTP